MITLKLYLLVDTKITADMFCIPYVSVQGRP